MTRQHAKAKENLTVNNLTSQHHRVHKKGKGKGKGKDKVYSRTGHEGPEGE